MATLYEIDERIKNCFTVGDSTIDGTTGEVLDEQALERLQIDRNEKIDSIGCYIKNLLSDADQYQKEAENQSMRAAQAKKNADRLKEFLASQLNGEKFSSPHVDIKWRKSKQVVITLPAEQLPFPYVVEKTMLSADKKAIKKSLEAGAQIPGCQIVEKNNIQVK